MNKAKIGDRIKSMNVVGLPDRGHFIGMVTKIEWDNDYQVDYVYYTAIVESRDGADKNVFKEMRTMQNGTKTLFGDLTNNIEIL
jgi:hypothetical protein